MIAYVEGSLAVKDPGYLVVDCHGVGYLVRISTQTYARVQGLDRARIWTHLQVKEDGHTLYGFAEQQERQVFELLIGISGVGGGTALTVLSGMSAGELATAVSRNDVNALKRIKGIGQKTAERIVLELRDKLSGAAAGGAPSLPRTAASKQRDEALAALLGLGFSRAQVEKRLDELLTEQPELSLEALVKLVLRGS
jgi:Holliday junction DNA helicase RuvA